jgi:hypothetical protein
MTIPNPTTVELERQAVMTVESTIPPDMTIEQWRRLRRPLPAGRRVPVRLFVLRARRAWLPIGARASYADSDGVGYRGNARSSWLRELMPSLLKTL